MYCPCFILMWFQWYLENNHLFESVMVMSFIVNHLYLFIYHFKNAWSSLYITDLTFPYDVNDVLIKKRSLKEGRDWETHREWRSPTVRCRKTRRHSAWCTSYERCSLVPSTSEGETSEKTHTLNLSEGHRHKFFRLHTDHKLRSPTLPLEM